MTDDRRESSFDELAKRLASGEVSRGQALRMMGAALVGGALASVPGIAWSRAPPKAQRQEVQDQIASARAETAMIGCASAARVVPTQCSGPAGSGCVPDSVPARASPQHRALPVCRTDPAGTNLMCICGDFSERLYCSAGSTCPDDRTSICRDVCGGEPREYWLHCRRHLLGVSKPQGANCCPLRLRRLRRRVQGHPVSR